VSLVDGQTRHIDWPENAFYHAEIPGLDRDAVLLLGIEPNLRWKTFTGMIVALAKELGVEMMITLGSLLADVPHTRPSPVTGGATDSELIERLGLQRSRYEGPTGIVGILHDACNRAGLRGVSLWATTPHYLRELPSPKAALALVHRASALLGTTVPTTELEIQSTAYERQVDDMLGNDDDLVDYVRRLEEDSEDDDDGAFIDGAELGPIDEEHIAASVDEIERFLRDQSS
jgi:proteasome assembly chaperone (PAC2) family protein